MSLNSMNLAINKEISIDLPFGINAHKHWIPPNCVISTLIKHEIQ